MEREGWKLGKKEKVVAAKATGQNGELESRQPA